MTELRQRDWPAFADLPEWHSEAACRDANSDWWFPDRGDSAAKAKLVCWNDCEVREECLDYAVSTGQRFGVWGGLSERERRRVKRERAA